MSEQNQKHEANASASSDEEPSHSTVKRIVQRLFTLGRSKNGDARRESLEELIENQAEDTEPISDAERQLLNNVLKLRDLTVEDVMIPRADIIDIEVSATLEEVLELVREHPRSRVPVYRDSSDNVVGLLTTKDLLMSIASGESFDMQRLLREPLFIAPSMRILDLMLEMRRSRIHMALVVDEFGGIDGLATIEDLIEEIVGEIHDEHETVAEPELIRCEDGTVLADARIPLEDFEDLFGALASEEEREEIDTLGGLVFAAAGRVPGRGEVIEHPGGAAITVIEADPRRVHRVRVARIAPSGEAEQSSSAAEAGR